VFLDVHHTKAPYEECRWSERKELELSGLAITDETLSLLPLSLESLKISDCPSITNKGIRSLYFLSKLQKLQIRHCIGISGIYFDALPSSLISLQILDCPNFSDLGLKAIGFLPITKLYIADCPITGAAFSYLPCTLKALKIENCPFIEEPFFPDLCLLTKLKKLELSSCYLRQETALFWPDFFECLKVNGCKIYLLP
jgi:hypothetical protein